MASRTFFALRWHAMDNLQAGVTATPLAADAGAIATTTGRWTTRPSFRLSWCFLDSNLTLTLMTLTNPNANPNPDHKPNPDQNPDHNPDPEPNPSLTLT